MTSQILLVQINNKLSNSVSVFKS